MVKSATTSKKRPTGKRVTAGRKIPMVKGYTVNNKRTPSQKLQKLAATPWQTLGPFFPYEFLIKPGENDLTRIAKGKPRAKGEIIDVVGRVLDEDGRPVQGALLEVWQCNEQGRYLHPVDQSGIPLDPNFHGVGRVITDAKGQYRIHTIKPGPYPVPGYDDWYRPRHIHFSLYAAGVLDRLITQMYFPREALNKKDYIFNALSDEKARRRLIGKESKGPRGTKTYSFDIVLKGRNETPFFED